MYYLEDYLSARVHYKVVIAKVSLLIKEIRWCGGLKCLNRPMRLDYMTLYMIMQVIKKQKKYQTKSKAIREPLVLGDQIYTSKSVVKRIA